MRVAMFTETYLPNRDGVVTSIVSSKESLEARGHRVAVFAPGEERRSEGDVHYFKAKEFKAYPDYRMPLYRSELGDVVEGFDPDVVHSHGTFFMGLKAVLSARRLEVPLVYTHHTNLHDAKHYVRAPLPDRTFEKLVWTGLRWYFRRTEAVIAPSRTTAEMISAQVDGDVDRLEVVPTGIDTDRFRPDVGTDLDLPEGPTVLHVGRIAPEKDVEQVVRTATLRPDLSFLVAGKGPHLEQVRALAEDLHADNVTFLGYVPDEDLPGLYAAADVFLTASKFETQGLVVLEALASGTPVVAPDIPVFREFVEPGESGVLTDDGPTTLARGIDEALAMEGADKAARRGALEYDEEVCADRLETAYRAVVGGQTVGQNL